MAQRAAAVASDDRCLDELASGVCSALPDEWGSKAWLRELRAALEGAPEGIKWRIGENLVLSKLSFRIGRSHGLRLAEFILGNGAMLELPGGASVRRREGGIEFSPCNG